MRDNTWSSLAVLHCEMSTQSCGLNIVVLSLVQGRKSKVYIHNRRVVLMSAFTAPNGPPGEMPRQPCFVLPSGKRYSGF